MDKRTSLKAALRGRCRTRAEALPEAYREEAGRAIARSVLASRAFREAETVFCYVCVPPEPDTREIIRQALALGKTVCVPRCHGGGRMDAVRIRTEQDLKPGMYGIPAPAEECEAVPPGLPDLCVIPCVSAGADGGRLGRGGGYYDRFLGRTRAVSLCLCYGQMLTEGLPMNDTDVRPDLTVTENGCVYAGPAGEGQA